MNFDWERFERLRTDLFEAIDLALAEDGHCKHYEGAFTIHLPNRFANDCSIELHCYVVGPNRHYEWKSSGGFNACLDLAEKDIRAWIGKTEIISTDSMYLE